MLGKFKTLLGHTLIYGLGNYGIKLIGFLLIPLYTRFLTPEDYGVMALVSMYTQALFVLMNLGQSVTLFRFYYERDNEEHRERVVAAALWIVLLFAIPIASLPLGFSSRISTWLTGTPAWWALIAIGTGTVLAKILLRMPFSIMRAGDQSKRYASWSLLRNGLATLLAVLFVAAFHLGATGVILSQFVGEIVMCILLTGTTLRMLHAGFRWADIKEQLVFGLPLVPAGIAAFALDLTDRWFLRTWHTVEDVGIYSLGYRFGEIVTFVVTAFQLSWPQFLFSHRKEPDAPQLYAHMTNYYLAVLLLLWLGLAVFASELITIMAPASYAAASAVVPVVAAAMCLDGVTFMVNIGPPFFKRTILRTYTLCTAALVNLCLNFLLIPKYGAIGAAWATFGGFLTQAIITFIVSLRLYWVPYQWARLGSVTLAAAAIYAGSLAIGGDDLALRIALKAILVLAYPAALIFGGFFEASDLAAACSIVERRSPAAGRILRRVLPGVST